MLVDMRELEKVLGVSRVTIFKYIKEGMPVVRISPRVIRFEPDNVVQWFKDRSVQKG